MECFRKVNELSSLLLVLQCKHENSERHQHGYYRTQSLVLFRKDTRKISSKEKDHQPERDSDQCTLRLRDDEHRVRLSLTYLYAMKMLNAKVHSSIGKNKMFPSGE